MTKALTEALKEGGRLLALGMVSLIVSFLLEFVLPQLDQTSVVTVLTVVLRMWDKAIHENNSDRIGLVPF